MSAPLAGVRVVEAATWLAAPAAAALLADLGAEVTKIEPPGGDPWRGFDARSMGFADAPAANAAFELDNRGKRSIAIDLERPGGPELRGASAPGPTSSSPTSCAANAGGWTPRPCAPPTRS